MKTFREKKSEKLHYLIMFMKVHVYHQALMVCTESLFFYLFFINELHVSLHWGNALSLHWGNALSLHRGPPDVQITH